MANEGNLKNWKKGQSGNPAGKPKTRLNEIAKAHAAAIAPDDPPDSLLVAAVKEAESKGHDPRKDPRVRQLKERCRAEVVLDGLYNSSVKFGSVRAAEEYLSRALGKPVTPLDVTSTVTHKTAAEHVEAILETLGRGKADDDSKLRIN
jgi:hypothetical protein